MKHRICIVVLFAMLPLSVVLSQSVEIAPFNVQNTTSVSQNRWSFVFGFNSVVDTYLSNQQYQGFTYGFDAQHYGTYRNTDKVLWSAYDRWRFAPMLINASYSATIMYGAVNLGYSTHYRWALGGGFDVMLGGVVDIHGAVKYQTRNVNNVAAGDVELQLHASAAAKWTHSWQRFALDVSYEVFTPIIGTFFMPEMGQSYYELYLTLPHGLNDVVHFSSFHNRVGARGQLAVDFNFKGFAFFVAFNHNYQYHAANNLECVDRELSGSLGFRLQIGNIKNW